MTDIGALAASFVRTQKAQGRSPHTIRTYSQCIQRLAAHLGSTTDIRAISRHTLTDYFAGRSETCKPATVSIDFRVLRVFFRWIVDEEELDRSPMEKMRQPRVPVAPVPTFTDDQLHRLIAACEGKTYRDRRDMAMLRLLLDVGLRRGEIAGLNLEDVSLEQQLARVTGKGKTRIVPFGTKASVALDRFLRADKRLGHHRTSLFGLTPSGVYQALRERAAVAGIEGWHTHRHRHDFASRFLMAGGDTSSLMTLAGWSSPTLVERYTASKQTDIAIAAHRRLSPGDRV